MRFTDRRTLVEQHRLNLAQMKQRYESETIRLRQLQDVRENARKILNRADVSKLLADANIDSAKFLNNEYWRIQSSQTATKSDADLPRDYHQTITINNIDDARAAADLVFAQLENRAKQGKLDYPAAEWLSGYINLGVRILSYGPGSNPIGENH